MGEALESMGINPPFLIAQTINFLIVFGALSVLLWKPVRKRLDERQEMLQQQRDDAEEAARQRENMEQEREKVLLEAKKEAENIVSEAYERVEMIKKDAEKQSEEIIQSARVAAQEEQNRVLEGMRERVVPIALAAAQKIIGTNLDEARQRALLDEFFSKVKDGKTLVLEGMDLSGNTAKVTSALPLTSKEKKVIESDILKQLGSDVKVDFAVNPNIIGGLVIKVDDKVYDHSVSGQLADLRSRLI